MQQIINRANAFSPEHWHSTATGIVVPTSYRATLPPFTGVDLFCGAGGFSLGFMQAGCKIVAACDQDTAASITYMYNLAMHPVNLVCPPSATRSPSLANRAHINALYFHHSCHPR